MYIIGSILQHRHSFNETYAPRENTPLVRAINNDNLQLMLPYINNGLAYLFVLGQTTIGFEVEFNLLWCI